MAGRVTEQVRCSAEVEVELPARRVVERQRLVLTDRADRCLRSDLERLGVLVDIALVRPDYLAERRSAAAQVDLEDRVRVLVLDATAERVAGTDVRIPARRVVRRCRPEPAA